MNLLTQTIILLTKPFKPMARSKKRTCSVTGITTSEKNFYSKQTHLKAIDNLRRSTGASKDQLKRMFNQIASY